MAARGSEILMDGSWAKDQKLCATAARGAPSPGGEGRGEGEPLLKLTSEGEGPTDGTAVLAGVTWLLDLQNSDGGIPTFCRGWTNLPFDRSAPDLTAHTLRAWNAWLPELPARSQRRVRRAIERGLQYLANTQTAEGTWIPLWFGNQHAPDETNTLYGTARVLLALTEIGGEASFRPIEKGAAWLLAAQKPDGSWGAPGNGPASVEETALAVEALAAVTALSPAHGSASQAREATMKGTRWLVDKVETGEWRRPSPIGFYFAKLWYFERLYPQIFTVSALGRVARQFETR